MSNKTIISIIISTILVLGIGIAIATNNGSSRIGELSQEIYQLQKNKQDCFDSLTYQESIRNEQGKEKFCVQFDEKIQTLRAEYDELTDLPYKHISVSGLE